jgi:hypothetical protein
MDKEEIMTASLQINKNSGFLVNGGQYGAFLTTSMGGDCRLAQLRAPPSSEVTFFKGVVPQD